MSTTTKFFGQFLLERGAITREQLLDAIKYQKEISKPLCALAIEKGALSRKQIDALDEEHQRSDRKFLEIAIRENMVSFQQLEDLCKAKSARWVFLGEALVNRGHLTLAQLNELFEDYRKEQPADDIFLEKVLAGLPEQDIVTSLLQVTADLFVHYTKQIVQIVSVEKAPADLEGVAFLFAQKVTGDKNFLFALALPEELVLKIASHMIQEKQKEVNATVLDAVSEFVNVIIGNGCTKLSMKDYKVHAEAPRIMTGETWRKLHPHQAVAVNMKTHSLALKVLFFFRQAETTS